jgi:acetyltransferase-like isoleucine patch superfamily enzyme
MHPIKYVWALRALVYKAFLKHVGNLTYIGKPCFIEGRKGISIGNRTRIFPGIRMEAIDGGEIRIGNNCAIEQNVHITAAENPLCIGDNVTILANTFITNLDHEYRDISCSVMEQGWQVKETSIGDGSFIGYGAAIQAGTTLGKHCVVGTGAVVRGTFEDYCVLVGCPARVVKRYDPKTEKWERV